LSDAVKDDQATGVTGFMVSIPFLDGTTEKGAASCCHVTGLHRGAGD